MSVPEAQVRANKPEKVLFDYLISFGQGLAAKPGTYELPVFENGRVSRVVVFDAPTDKKRYIVRGYVSGKRVFIASVEVEPKVTAKDADIQPFLDNMRPLK